MNEDAQNKTIKPILSHQRRTQSVDEEALHTLDNISYEINGKDIKEKLTNGKHNMPKQISDGKYVCEILPRTNNRPSAKTCW